MCRGKDRSLQKDGVPTHTVAKGTCGTRTGSRKVGTIRTKGKLRGRNGPLDDGLTRPVKSCMPCTSGATRQLRSMKTGGRTTISVCATGVSSWPGG